MVFFMYVAQEYRSLLLNLLCTLISYRTAFPLWILANMYFFFNPRIGGVLMCLMGFLMIVGNLCWRFIRNPFDLKIPFEEGILEPKFGWCFWLNLIAGK